jgi:hypothetical protein
MKIGITEGEKKYKFRGEKYRYYDRVVVVYQQQKIDTESQKQYEREDITHQCLDCRMRHEGRAARGANEVHSSLCTFLVSHQSDSNRIKLYFHICEIQDKLSRPLVKMNNFKRALDFSKLTTNICFLATVRLRVREMVAGSRLRRIRMVFHFVVPVAG